MSEAAESTAPSTARRAPPASRVAAVVYVVCVAVYALFASERLLVHSPDNHFSYLADSYLHHTLAVRCTPETLANRSCPPGGGGNDWALYDNRWYVAFPPFPAVLYMLPVALFGREFANARFDVLLAGIAPALLYLLLERLARENRSSRTWRENLAFTALYAFGTVYFFSAVQGSVWFVAHIVGAALGIAYLGFALDARSPFLAGLMLALAFQTRADLVYLAPWFALEVLRVRMRDTDPSHSLRQRFRTLDVRGALGDLVRFAIPVALSVALYVLLNRLRFGEFGDVGYRYLQIGWRGRIERWGLFNYHYLARNLAVAFTLLPWLTSAAPYVVISLHGLALWFTTPHLVGLVRMRRTSQHPYTAFLALSAGTVALTLLLYQNSGWQQFGYRFSNDFAAFLVVLLALDRARTGRLWKAAFVVALVVNAFGALTFGRTFTVRGRHVDFYDNDNSQTRFFQPD